ALDSPPPPRPYRFLCALQHQGVAGSLGWSWGPLEAAPFLPRVLTGRAVLSKARWNLGPAEVARLRAADPAGRFAAVQGWREEAGLPRWIALVERDAELPIDLDNALSVDTFLARTAGRERVSVVELFPAP